MNEEAAEIRSQRCGQDFLGNTGWWRGGRRGGTRLLGLGQAEPEGRSSGPGEAGQEPPQDSTRDPFQLQMQGPRVLSNLRAFTPNAEVARDLGTQSRVPGVETLVIPGLRVLRKEVPGGGVRLDAPRQGRRVCLGVH